MLQPTLLPFSFAGPGQTASGGVELTAPGAASLTAAITTGPAGPDWHSSPFNLESQAAVGARWFAGEDKDDKFPANAIAMDPTAATNHISIWCVVATFERFESPSGGFK
jgi:hypothetical protein